MDGMENDDNEVMDDEINDDEVMDGWKEWNWVMDGMGNAIK